MFLRRALPLLSCCVVLVACQQSAPTGATFADPKPVNLAGSWEVDHARSDNIQTQLNAMIRELQRQAERQPRTREAGPSVSVGGGGRNSGRSIIGLAEMAELITAPELLDVHQTDSEIRIKRDNSFALVCDLTQEPPVVTETPFGRESCGWDGSQLIFTIALPEGLSIRHRISGSLTGELLGMTTTVYSDQVSQPFTVNKVFGRYDPENAGYRCEQTLSRGRVCTTESRPASP